MRQIFLLTEADTISDFDGQDAFPMSERLLSEFEARFQPTQQDKNTFVLPAEQSLKFLRGFYADYELSQPQRRVFARLEKKIEEISSDQSIQFIVADVSEQRSRRQTNQLRKKTEQLY